MRRRDLVVVFAVVALVASVAVLKGRRTESEPTVRADWAAPAAAAPAAPRPRMVDVGASSCLPCKYMAPILEEARRELAGVADVVFVDLREDRDAADRYGIRAMPTQIFYDREGREVWRHEGVLEKPEIVTRLRELAREPAPETGPGAAPTADGP